MVIRSIICVWITLTVAPLITSIALVCLAPSRWGGHPNVFTVLTMAVFGVISAPIWPTYIPTIVLVPMVMIIIAKTRFFIAAPLPLLVAIFAVLGSIVGLLVIGRIALMLFRENELGLAVDWIVSGALAGTISSSLILLCYRWR